MAMESSPEHPQPLGRVVSAVKSWVERCGAVWVEAQVIEIRRRSGAATELTTRELEVLRVIARGGTNGSAAEHLLVSEATVKTHLLHAYAKLGVGDRAAAVRVAYERGLL